MTKRHPAHIVVLTLLAFTLEAALWVALLHYVVNR